MTLKEIVDQCNSLKIFEKRCNTEEYSELVFFNNEQAKWDVIFSEILGPPIKPAGVKPSKDDLRMTEEYGGIFDNQILFKKEFEGTAVVAMFWPWQDKVHTTLKLALLKK